MYLDLGFFFHDVPLSNKPGTMEGPTTKTTIDRGIPLETPNSTTQQPVKMSNEESYDEFYFPAIGVLVVIGVVGNFVVVLQVIRDKQLHTPTFAVIGSVACADMMFLLIRIPAEFVFKFVDDWIFGDVGCRLYMYLIQCVSYSEAYHLVILAIIRYYQLTNPLEAYRRLTTTKTLFISIGLWLGIFVILSPVLVFTGVTRYYMGPTDTKGYEVCYLKTNSKVEQKAYFLCYSIFCCLLPLFLLIVFHVGKAVKVRKVSKFSKNDKQFRVMSVAVAAILVLFGILQAPVHINNILIITETVKYRALVSVIVRLMTYLKSVINPLVYAFCAKKVRDSCLKCFSCCKASRKDNFNSQSRSRAAMYITESNT